MHRNPGDPLERRFNIAHKKTRAVIEHTYGTLKNRFMCLQQTLRVDPSVAAKIIVVCAALHNLAILNEYNTDRVNMQRFAPRNEPGRIKLEELLNYFA